MKTKAPLALLLSFCFFTPVLGQTLPPPPPPPQQTLNDKDDDVVRITTNLVQVDAVVTKDGKPVTDLTAADFEIYEDGKRQTITSFAYVSNVPGTTPQPVNQPREKGAAVVPFNPIRRDDPHRIVALVVDDLGMSAESMGQVRKQLRKFVTEQLQPHDLVAVIRTSGNVGVLQQFTNDPRVLTRAVDQLRWNICNRVGVHLFTPAGVQNWRSCGSGRYGNTVRSLQFIVDSMGKLPGRKSLVLFSDSLPVESQDEFYVGDRGSEYLDYASPTALLNNIAEKAIRSSVVIYSVDTQGLVTLGPTAADSFSGNINDIQYQMRSVLTARSDLLWRRREGGELLARQTGGFQVRNSNSFRLDRIMQDQSGYYLLGYRPTEETFNRRFHHIKAKVKRSGMSLRTRFGFFGISEEDVIQRPLSRSQSANLALASPFGVQDIEVDLTSFFTHDKSTGSVVRSFVYITAKDLTFEKVEGGSRASIELHGVIFGDNGALLEHRARGATVNLVDRDYEYVMRHGLALRFDIPVKRPGSYQVRIATRDRTSSKIGTAGQFVEVPDIRKQQLAVSGIVLGTPAGARSSARDANQIIEGTGTRKFPQNVDLDFAFVAYNLAGNNALVMESKLFRDGRIVYAGPEIPIEVGNQADPNRMLVSGSFKLPRELEPGNYFLQIVISDKSAAKKKAPKVAQWVDFEIMKENNQEPGREK